MRKKLPNVAVMLLLAVAAAYAAKIGYEVCAGWLIFTVIVIGLQTTSVDGRA